MNDTIVYRNISLSFQRTISNYNQSLNRAKMTQLLIHISEPNEGTFQKITSCIYYNTQNCNFYRLSILPNTVIFQNEQISQPHFTTMTQYDPYFFLINLLLKRNVNLQQVPNRFKHLKIQLISDVKNDGGQEVCVLNKTKVYDYLESKVKKLEKCLSDKLGEKGLQVDKSMADERGIGEETVMILKSEIEDKNFVDAFAKERYNYENIRKLAPYVEEPEETIPKKKVAPKKEVKKQEKRLEHGQKTLFGFFGGKK